MECPICKEIIKDGAVKCKHCGSMIASTPHAEDLSVDAAITGIRVRSGALLGGRYEIIKKIARGGMGIIYYARDNTLGMDIAVKVLPFELSSDEQWIERLKIEAKTTMMLTHENIMRLYGFEDVDNMKFLKMEYIDGSDFTNILNEKEEKRFSLEEVLKYAEGMVAGLEYAHNKNIIHRDIKPSNIMLTSQEVVKITDFGIARKIKEAMTRITQTMVSGTLLYMSPEQLMGGKVSRQSDIYSLAAMLYELLSGSPPFYKGAIAEQIRTKKPKPLENLPDRVIAGIQKALAKDPADRWGSIKGFYKILTGEKPITTTIEIATAATKITPTGLAPEKVGVKERIKPKIARILKKVGAKAKIKQGIGFAVMSIACVILLAIAGYYYRKSSRLVLPTDVAKLQKLLENKKGIIKDKDDKLKKAESLLNTEKKAKEEAKKELKALRQDAKGLKDEVKKKEVELKAQKSKAKQMEDNLKKKEGELKTQKSKEEQITKDLEKERKDLEKKRKEIEDLKRDIAEKKGEISKLNKRIEKELDPKIKKLESDVANLEKRTEFVRKTDPSKCLKKANKYLEEERYAEAMENYGLAARLAKTKELQIKALKGKLGVLRVLGRHEEADNVAKEIAKLKAK